MNNSQIAQELTKIANEIHALSPTINSLLEESRKFNWEGIIAALISFLIGAFYSSVTDAIKAPKLRIKFINNQEPYCRKTTVQKNDTSLTRRGVLTYWIRLGIENFGRKDLAVDCIGKLSKAPDVDPLQLRWAGVPDIYGFNPISLVVGQNEFLNLIKIEKGGDWWSAYYVTHEGEWAGFSMKISYDIPIDFEVTILSKNAKSITKKFSFKYSGVSNTADREKPQYEIEFK